MRASVNLQELRIVRMILFTIAVTVLSGYTRPVLAQDLEGFEMVRHVEDPVGDFNLDHAMFSYNFGIEFVDNEIIPPSLDLVRIEIIDEGEENIFILHTEGDALPDLLGNDRKLGQIGIYIDVDLDARSDLLVTTTVQPGQALILNRELEVISEVSRFEMGENSIQMGISKKLTGDKFNWVAFSGYTPVEGAVFLSSAEEVYFLPQVDTIIHPSLLGEMIATIKYYLGRADLSTVYYSGIINCPPALIDGQPNPYYKIHPTAPLPGVPPTSGGKQVGVKISEQTWPNLSRATALWCSGSFYREVSDTSQQGWMARCPYPCGQNEMSIWSPTIKGRPSAIIHQISNKPCNYTGGEVVVTAMRHSFYWEYYNPGWENKVRSCQRQRYWGWGPHNGKMVSGTEKCLPPVPLYKIPNSVPGSLP